jgi:hypothetical protein
MDVRLTLGRKNRLLDFSFLNRQVRDGQWATQIVQGNPKADFLEQYKPDFHSAKPLIVDARMD